MAKILTPEFLRVIAVWSLVPSYIIAGGAVGYSLDMWLSLFPYITGAGILCALGLAVRDMLKLKDVFK